MKPLALPPSPSILVIKMSAMGDLVQALPCVHVLRTTTSARITWVADSGLAELLRGHPDIDQVIEFPRDPYAPATLARGGFRIGRKLLQRLRRESFDLAIDLQGLVRSWLVLGLARAPAKIARGRCPFADRKLPHRRGLRRHAAVACFELLAPLGIPVPGDLSEIEPPLLGLPSSGAEKGADRVCLLPFTTWPSKHWTLPAWAGLADWLAGQGFHVTLLGGPSDIREANRIESRMVFGSRLENLCGQVRLSELKDVFAASRLAVGVDTGPLHVASASGCPTLSLFGGSDPARTAPWGGRGSRVVQAPGCHACCRRRCRQRCLQRLPLATVIEAASDILAGAGHTASSRQVPPVY